MRVLVWHLLARLRCRVSRRRVRSRLSWYRCAGIAAVGQRRGNAHDDGSVIAWLGAEAVDVALKQNSDIAIGIAQRGFKTEHAGGIACTSREAKLLRASSKTVCRRDLVWTRQRRSAADTVDILEHERGDARARDLNPAAADAHLVEQHFLGNERQSLSGPTHIAPIAGAVVSQREPEHRLGDGDLARLYDTTHQRADIEPGFDRPRLEQRLVEAALRVRHLHIIEAKLWRRQKHHVHIAADPNVTAKKLACLGFKDRTVVVPVNKEGCREERAQHQNQHCCQGEQKRVHGSLCLRLDRELSRGGVAKPGTNWSSPPACPVMVSQRSYQD